MRLHYTPGVPCPTRHGSVSMARVPSGYLTTSPSPVLFLPVVVAVHASPRVPSAHDHRSDRAFVPILPSVSLSAAAIPTFYPFPSIHSIIPTFLRSHLTLTPPSHRAAKPQPILQPAPASQAAAVDDQRTSSTCIPRPGLPVFPPLFLVIRILACCRSSRATPINCFLLPWLHKPSSPSPSSFLFLTSSCLLLQLLFLFSLPLTNLSKAVTRLLVGKARRKNRLRDPLQPTISETLTICNPPVCIVRSPPPHIFSHRDIGAKQHCHGEVLRQYFREERKSRDGTIDLQRPSFSLAPWSHCLASDRRP